MLTCLGLWIAVSIPTALFVAQVMKLGSRMEQVEHDTQLIQE